MKSLSFNGFCSVSDYLNELNTAQRAAVEKTEGPVMIIAGAGSGKTRVLTYRIAHLIRKGVDPFQILSLTFTNKAAKEMKERIAAIVGSSDAKNIWMGTFHSVFAKIIRFEADKLGYPSNFTIYDADDAKRLITRIIKDMNLDKDVYKASVIQSRISQFKNNLITVKAYYNNPELQSQDDSAHRPQMGKIYENYTRQCFKSGAMDFDDLLLKTNELLHKFPDVLSKYQQRFRYIMVDEYQDTNHSQYLIVKALASRFENLCVVGDDAQSIYAFRGANIQNILNFKRDYSDATILKLEQNYRSTQNIVNAANSIINKNKDQFQKNVWTDNQDGDKIRLLKATTEGEEAALIASSIMEIQHNQQLPYKDFAILYRTNSQSRALEEALRKRGVTYRIYGGLSFYQRKEIKDLIAYFRVCINPTDEEALRRIINYPTRGIGQTSIDRINVAANQYNQTFWEIIDNIQLYETGINKGGINKITDFAMMIKSFRAFSDSKNAFELAQEITKGSGILKLIQQDKTPEGVSRYENIQELLNGIKNFVEKEPETPEEEDKSLAHFIEDIALLTDADKDNDENADHVSLMTIHQSKGLEFPHVYIAGLEENLFPSQMSVNSRADLEEERRLFYVAVTRAEKKATLSYAITRYRWGNLIDSSPSRFIEEIDPKYLEESAAALRAPRWVQKPKSNGSSSGEKSFKPAAFKSKPKKAAPKKIVNRPKNLKPLKAAAASSGNESFVADKDFAKGMRVNHERFGQGDVVDINGLGANKKIIVNFDDAGQKTLIVKFARLQIIK